MHGRKSVCQRPWSVVNTLSARLTRVRILQSKPSWSIPLRVESRATYQMSSAAIWTHIGHQSRSGWPCHKQWFGKRHHKCEKRYLSSGPAFAPTFIVIIRGWINNFDIWHNSAPIKISRINISHSIIEILSWIQCRFRSCKSMTWRREQGPWCKAASNWCIGAAIKAAVLCALATISAFVWQ